jgi:MazG family protein
LPSLPPGWYISLSRFSYLESAERDSGIGAELGGGTLQKLVELVAHLRGKDGCPWDRQQDYDSIKGLLLEEAYELADAVGRRDPDALADELGDLLFLVVFYARLAEEEGHFTLDDAVERLHAKLVRRHPHVFGERHAATAEEALSSWMSVKEAERVSKPALDGGSKSLLDGIPALLPATLEAYELGVRAAEARFDWARVEDLLDKIEEEVRELRHALGGSAAPRSPQVEEEVGDLMFAAANLARFLRFDPETCLRRANQKFKRRFQALEAEVSRRGKRLRECSLEELDALWNELKRREAT